MNETMRVEKALALTKDIAALYEAAKASGDRETASRLWNERAQMIADAGLQQKPWGTGSRAGQRQAAERRAMATRRTR